MNADAAFSLIIAGTIVVLFICAPAAMLVGLGTPQDASEYRGDVVDFTNEQGLVMQTSSVEIKTDPTSSTAERFCVHPDNRGEVLPALQLAQDNGHRVTITYERPLFVPAWDCGVGTKGRIITDVTVHQGGSDA